ncbi:autophagy protein 5-like [Oscarella lobularis]|uniref:autophagy protein 5-like n=1 Tax=Oscarella lobularis TaxID=121494 RepID=UPI0033132DF7
MAEDTEVLREVWNGRVPVCFRLDPHELSTIEEPEPYFLLLPRMSYLPLVTDKVKMHFKNAVRFDDGDEMWFEFDDQPLKWQHPIGLLFDLHGNPEQLPWSITVHFKRFPEDSIIRCPGDDAVESLFMSTVKEADFLKHRGAVMNAMHAKEHRQIWTGLKNDRFEHFWEMNNRLMTTADAPFRSIPYRIHQADKPFIQEPIKPNTVDDTPNSLGDLIQERVPHAFPNESGESSYRILIQGIEPPLTTPLQYLSKHFSHPDNFLHIAVVSR